MEAIKCDRCGVLEDKNYRGSKGVFLKSWEATSDRTKDLCNNCDESLQQWWKRK